MGDGRMGSLELLCQNHLQQPGVKHGPSIHLSSALLCLLPSSFSFSYLWGHLCARDTLVYLWDFRDGADVSTSQPDREVGDALGSAGDRFAGSS